MTERLSALLHDSADHLAVPLAPAPAIISRGRSLRRRARRLRAGIGIAAVVATVAGTAFLLPGKPTDDRASVLAPAVPIDPDGWAVAQGSTIHLGSGATSTVPGKVKAMYYTSAGVMVRTGRTAYTEGDATSNYFVLDRDGTVRDFSLDLGDKKPGSDPTLPYLAYSVRGADSTHWELVLRDVRTGQVATRIPYEGAFTWGGWNAPPTALSGDYAYVGVDDATLSIAWRTGEVKVAKGLSPSWMPTVSGGRELTMPPYDGPAGGRVVDPDEKVTKTYKIVDAVTGELVQTFDVTGTLMDERWPRLAPDGEHILLVPTAMCDESGKCVYEDSTTVAIDVDTGARHEFELGGGQFGWSPDGRILVVEDHRVRSCDADTGSCRDTAVELSGEGTTRVSGNDNES